jgi:hypothetical protein
LFLTVLKTFRVGLFSDSANISIVHFDFDDSISVASFDNYHSFARGSSIGDATAAHVGSKNAMSSAASGSGEFAGDAMRRPGRMSGNITREPPTHREAGASQATRPVKRESRHRRDWQLISSTLRVTSAGEIAR